MRLEKNTTFIGSVVLAFILIVGTSSAKGADTIRLLPQGSKSLVGTISKISPQEVEIVRSINNVSIKVPANTISVTQYDQEPSQMAALRTAVLGSRFEEALEIAKKLESENFSKSYVKEDYDFFVAYATTQIALYDLENRRQIQNAIVLNGTFLQKHSRSYHFFPVWELLGELYVASGNMERAFQAFTQLNKAPWIETKWKSNLSLGNICLIQSRVDEAKTYFQTVLDSIENSDNSAKTDGAERARTESQIGLAKCLLQSGKLEEGIAALEKLSIQTDSEDAKLQAAIYFSLGEAYEEMKNPHEAILAYLHIDILFPSAKTERIAAMKRLIVLWNQVNRPERSAEVERTLREIQ